MRMIKVRLLNDGGYGRMGNVQFPVEVWGTHYNDQLIKISQSELLRITNHQCHWADYDLSWLIGEECEIISTIEEPPVGKLVKAVIAVGVAAVLAGLVFSRSAQAAGVCDATDVGRHMREAIGHGQVCLPIAEERGLSYAVEHYSDVCSAMMRSVRLANDVTIRLDGHGCTVVSNGPTVGEVTVYRAMTVKMLELAERGW